MLKLIMLAVDFPKSNKSIYIELHLSRYVLLEHSEEVNTQHGAAQLCYK